MHDAKIISWTTMIEKYVIYHYNKDVIKIFYLMKHFKTNPNNITFVCVLLVCMHTSLVDESCKYFNNMSDSYCIIPIMDHIHALFTFLVV